MGMSASIEEARARVIRAGLIERFHPQRAEAIARNLRVALDERFPHTDSPGNVPMSMWNRVILLLETGDDSPATTSPSPEPPTQAEFLDTLARNHTAETPTQADSLAAPELEQCAICYEPIVAPFKTDCNHIFCLECAKSWFPSSNTCPNCRKVLYQKDDDGLEVEDDEEDEDIRMTIRHDIFERTCRECWAETAGWVPVDHLVRKVNNALGRAHVHFDEVEALDLFEWHPQLQVQLMPEHRKMRAMVRVMIRGGPHFRSHISGREVSDEEPPESRLDVTG